MEIDRYIELIYKYLKSEIKDDEILELEKYKNSSMENLEVYREIELTWRLSNSSEMLNTNELNEDWKKLAFKMEKKPANRRRLTLLLSGIAAAITILIASLFIFNNSLNKNKIEIIALENQTLELPDGSVVYVQKDSKLSYERSYLRDRKISFEGSGLFEIIHNPKNPLNIELSSSLISVLGTRFFIKENSNELEVFLIEGSIQFSADPDTIILKPGEYVKFSENLVSRSDFQSNNIEYLKNGSFRYSATDLKSILEELENLFDIEIVLENTVLLDCEINLLVNNSDYKIVLERIAQQLEMDLEISGKLYMLKNGICM